MLRSLELNLKRRLATSWKWGFKVYFMGGNHQTFLYFTLDIFGVLMHANQSCACKFIILMSFNQQCYWEIWCVESKYAFRCIIFGTSLICEIQSLYLILNRFMICVSFFKVINYILETISPLEVKTVSDLLQKSSVIGSALHVLEKVPHQSLVSWLGLA